MSSISPVKFLREVKIETGKITWPSRKETLITTAMVFVFVAIAALFFLGVDAVIGFGIRYVMGW